MSKTFKRIVTLVLAIVMVISVVPFTAFAEGTDAVINDGKQFGLNGYYNVISKKDYTLVPGAAYESEMVLNNATGTRRQVLHIIEVDPSNPDVSLVPGYHQIDKDLTDEANWSHKELTEMAKYYEDNLGYNIVGGMNTDLYYSTYAPRVLVYNGKSIGQFGIVDVKDDKGNTVKLGNTGSILYVLKDAEGKISCEVKAFNKTEFNAYLESGTLLHAVGVSFAMTVKDGELVNKKETRATGDSAAARSMVGVKEDGTLVICMNDGRGANNSVGFDSFELGESMLALGCKWAANCDGGGSSTFISKRVGEETFTMRSVPCDGAQRPTAHGIFVTSNVAPTGILENVNIESEYDYFAPKTEYSFGAEAIDTHGYAMEMPTDATWALSDTSFGTIVEGKFVSNGKKGEVDVQVVSGDKVIGSKTIKVTDPEVFKLSATSTVVPYSTPEKIRTITLPIIAKIGEANVYMDTNAVSVALSNDKAGILDGFKFTATEDTTIAGVDVTITYSDITLTYAIEFGKGSEVIFDFEDGNKAGFVGYADAKAWSEANGVKNGLFDSPYPHGGQMDPFTVATTLMGTTENGGQVKNGNNALAWRFDNTDPDFEAWSYYYLYNIGESVVLRDVENDKKAIALGMWVYVPEDTFVASNGTSFSFQAILWVRKSDGSMTYTTQNFMFTSAATGKQINLLSAKNEDIPESRWVYMSADISAYDYVCTPIATSNSSWSPAFIRSYAKPKYANEVTFYIDDITLDYSSAVDDRILPTITAPTYSASDTAVSLENGKVISGEKFAFSATVADNAALDLNSGKIFVDGHEVKSAIVGNMLSTKEDVALIAGTHTVAFEVKDELGNPAKITKTFTVAGDAVIELAGHNDSGEAPKAQSIYYVDINVADLSKVDEMVAVLKLQTANTWETKGAIVANGFKVNYSYNNVSQLLTVTVEKTGVVNAGAGALVSIPVRIWTYNRYDYLVEKPVDKVSNNKPDVDIECKVVYGSINGTPFGGNLNVATELTTISSPYHIHDAELTVLNKNPSVTEYGYENRTYCETCKSVVDWGTVIEKLSHNYQIVDGKFVCADDGCGEVYDSGTGVFEMNGKTYYSIAGNLVMGWQEADGTWYYFTYDYSAATGDYRISSRVYFFNEDGSLIGGQWFMEGGNYRYYIGPTYPRASNGATISCMEIDGYTYGFDTDGYRIENDYVGRTGYGVEYKLYHFDAEGRMYDAAPTTGIVVLNNGTYYLVNDIAERPGLVKVGEDYYYIKTDYHPATGRYYVNRTNDLMPAGYYDFAEDGKMICAEANGVVDGFYYVDGVIILGAGLVEYNGDYYYVRSDGSVATGRYYVNKPNGLTEAGYYDFAEDGKLIMGGYEGGIINGYYYKDGILMAGVGLIQLNGDYYYVRSDGSVATGRYYVNKPNGLIAAGYYDFAENGKMIRTEANGVVNGFYYEDGVIILGAGLVEYNGDYYYVRSNGAVATGRYYVNKSNGLIAAGYYDFAEDGKMIRTEANGVVNGFYYEDGVIILGAGLVEYNGDYYYVRSNGAVATGRYYVNKPNGFIAAGYYDFAEDGKMIRTEANGVVNGFYYEDGVIILGAGLVEYNGDYYYVRSNGAVATGRYYVNKPNGFIAAGYYDFAEDGKMIGE